MNRFKYLITGFLLTLAVTATAYRNMPQLLVGDPAKPHGSAIFQMESTTKGFLPPRMTTVERDAIASPAEGLIIYNTDTAILDGYAVGVWSSISGGAGSDHPIWITGLSYPVGYIVVNDLDWRVYRSNTLHTSSATIAIDIALGYWDELANDLNRLTSASSTDNSIVRWDGTDGDNVQNSAILIDDTDNIGGVTSLAVGAASATSSSALDVVSTTQGTRPCPAMTEAQRDAIGSPATSLCIYNTDVSKLNIYNGVVWVAAGGGLDKWETSKVYKIDDVVWEISTNNIFVALSDHTSGTFATDSANWSELVTKQTIDIEQTYKVGNPTHIDTLNEMVSHMWAGGVVDGGELTDNLDGTIDMATSTAMIRESDDEHVPLYSVVTTGLTAQVLTDNSVNYIYVDYNSGSPQFAVTTTEAGFNGNDKILTYTVVRVGTTLKIIDARNQNVNTASKARGMFLDFAKFIHKQGTSAISEVGTRNLAITEGKFYYMVNPLPHVAFDTSIAGTANENVFTYYYQGTQIDDSKQIDNLQYDNAGVLTTLGNNKYKVDWVYVLNNTPSSLAVVYGQQEYATLSDAEAAQIPSVLPTFVSEVGSLVGRLILQESSTNIDIVASAFQNVFTAATPTSHNGLTGLQGGTTDEYYHFPNISYGFLFEQDQLVSSTSSPSFEGVSIALGSTALPSLTFTGDPDTGIYSPGANQIHFAAQALDKFTVSTSQIKFLVPTRQANGTEALPSYSWQGMTDGGIFRDSGTDSIRMAVNGVTNTIWDDGTLDVVGNISGEGKGILGNDPYKQFNSKAYAEYSVIGDISSGSSTTFGDDTGTITGTLAIITGSLDTSDTKYFQYTMGAVNDYWYFTVPTDESTDIGYRYRYSYDGADDDIATEVRCTTSGEDLTQGVHLTKAHTLSTQAGTVFVPTGCGDLKIGFHVKTFNSGKIFKWNRLTVTDNPFVYKDLVVEQEYTIEQANNAMTAISSYAEFNLGTATISDEGVKIITASSVGGKTRFTASQDCVVNIHASARIATISRSITILKNDLFYMPGSAAEVTDGLTHVGTSVKLSEGGYLTIATSVNGGLATSGGFSNLSDLFKVKITAQANTENIIAYNSKNAENLVVEGASNGGGSVTANVTDIDFTEVTDSGYGGANWNGAQFTVPEDGLYSFSGHIRFTTSASPAISLYIDTVKEKSVMQFRSQNSKDFSFTRSLVKNQVISMRSDNTLTLFAAVDTHYISITKIGVGDLLGVPVPLVGYVKDVKASGTNGGAASALTVHTRDLNTVSGDTSFMSLSSNQITLTSGVYEVYATMPALSVDAHQGFLYDVTNTTYVIDGSSEYTDQTGNGYASSRVIGKLTITSPTTYELRHYTVGSKASSGLGIASNNTNNPQSGEVYTQVKITKLR